MQTAHHRNATYLQAEAFKAFSLCCTEFSVKLPYSYLKQHVFWYCQN